MQLGKLATAAFTEKKKILKKQKQQKKNELANISMVWYNTSFLVAVQAFSVLQALAKSVMTAYREAP